MRLVKGGPTACTRFTFSPSTVLPYDPCSHNRRSVLGPSSGWPRRAVSAPWPITDDNVNTEVMHG
eukprot:2845746-Prymnesium_polylepis.1